MNALTLPRFACRSSLLVRPSAPLPRLSPCMADMVELKVVDLSWNRLEGSITSDFFSKLVNLVDLNLGVNKVSKKIVNAILAHT